MPVIPASREVKASVLALAPQTHRPTLERRLGAISNTRDLIELIRNVFPNDESKEKALAIAKGEIPPAG